MGWTRTFIVLSAFLLAFPAERVGAAGDDLIRGLLGIAAKELGRQGQRQAAPRAEPSTAEGRLTATQRRDIQQALNRLGFDVGKPDGAFGPATRRGIARYQAALGHEASGHLSAPQIAELLGAGAGEIVSNDGGFDVLRGYDLPGNDLVIFRDVGLPACRALCDERGECSAYTYNTAKNVCFLKSAASTPVGFADAVSGRRTGATDVAVQARAGDFKVLANSDLPGGDYRSGFDDPALKDVALSDCQQLCAADERCRGYTYNQNARVCFLKQEVGTKKAFAGAFSGIKHTASAAAAGGTRDVGLAWRDDDSRESFVARVRAAAAPHGGRCEAEKAAIAGLASGLSVTSETMAVEARNPVAITWRRGAPDRGVPAYLIVATDQPVRFRGEGFYALLPGAIAPFGIDVFGSSTRAIVALYGNDVPESGRIEVVPLVSGQLDVKWSLAGYVRRCEEAVVTRNELAAVTVRTASTPEFFVNDPFSLKAPERRLVSSTGRHLLEDLGGRYRLSDRETGAILADRSGTDANFSPTGRFLAARNDDGFDVLDTVDGQLVRVVGEGDLGWENADSFLVHGGTGYGIVEAHNVLVADLSFGGSTSCRICPGTLDISMRIDLENDVVHHSGFLSGGVQRLSGSQAATGEAPELKRLPEEGAAALAQGAIDRFVARRIGIAPTFHPRHWSFRGGLKFSHLAAMRASDSGGEWDQQSVKLPDYVVAAPELERGGEGRQASVAVNGIGRWRGARPLISRPPGPSRIIERLETFGYRFAARHPKRTAANSLPDTDRDRRLAEAIMKDVPAAGDAFAIGAETSMCRPAGLEGFEHDQILAKFDQVFAFDIGDRRLWITRLSCAEGSAAFFYENFYLFDSASGAGAVAIDGENTDTNVGTMCFGNIGFCSLGVDLYANRHLLFWSRASRGMVVVDIASGKTIFRKFDLPRGDLLDEARMTEDGAHVVQINGDGSFYTYDVVTGAQVLEGRYVDDEMVVWAPDLRFDATAEGANYVNLRFPGERGQFTFEQFRATLATRGLAEIVMRGALAPSLPQFQAPPRLTAAFDEVSMRISGTATFDAGDGSHGEIRVFQDGLLTDTVVAAGGGSVAFDVARLPGARWASLVAVNERGLASLPVGRDLGTDARELPVVRVLAVGVDRYDSPDLADLSYAVADASTLADALRQREGQSISLADPAILPDAEASPGAVLEAARAMAEAARPGETLVFFFAGHGLRGPDGRFYMATGETRTDQVVETALAWEELAAILRRARSRVVVFLDACHSGTAGTGLLATNDNAAADVLASLPSGLVVLSASKGRQFSEEAPAAGGGVFTNAVADVIARERDSHDLDGNGAIEVSELYAGIKRLVIEQTSGRQTPWLARNQMVGDFALF